MIANLNGNVLLAMLFVFSSFLFPTFEITSSLPRFQFNDFLMPFIFLVLLSNQKILEFKAYYLFLFGFAIYILFTIFLNGSYFRLNEYFEIYKLLKYAGIVAFFSLIPFESWRILIKPIAILLVIFNLFHFFELFGINEIIKTHYGGGMNITLFGKTSLGEPAAKRMVGITGNPNSSALLYACFSFYFLFTEKIIRSKIAWFALFLSLAFMCQSRTGLLAISVAIIIVFIFRWVDFNYKQFALLFTVTLSCYVLSWMLCSQFFKYSIYVSSMADLTAFESNSILGRAETWKYLGKMILEKPIFGYGPNKDFFYQINMHADNEYIQFAWRYGTVGLVAFFSIFLLPVRFLRHQKSNVSHRFLFTLLILFAISAITNAPFTDRMTGVFFAIAIGVFFQVYSVNRAKTL